MTKQQQSKLGYEYPGLEDVAAKIMMVHEHIKRSLLVEQKNQGTHFQVQKKYTRCVPNFD